MLFRSVGSRDLDVLDDPLLPVRYIQGTVVLAGCLALGDENNRSDFMLANLS